MKNDPPGEDGGNFAALLGVFGSHADPVKRGRAERSAAMKVDDQRRRPGSPRVKQYLARITESKHALAERITSQTKKGNSDIVEEGIDLVAARYGVSLDV
jgi:hypothetical protein